MRLGREIDDRVAARQPPRATASASAMSPTTSSCSIPSRFAGIARVRQLVEHDDLVAAGGEPPDEVRADEAGTAGDENAHSHRVPRAQAIRLGRAASGRSSWSAASSTRSAARHSARPSRQCGSSGAPFSLRSTEYAGRGARAPNSAVVMRRTRHASPASSKIASANSAHVQSPSAATCQMPYGSRPTISRVARRGGRHTWAATLVVHHRDLVALGAEPRASCGRSCARSGRRATSCARSRPARPPPPRRGASCARTRTADSGRPTRRTARPCGRRRRSRSRTRRAARRARRHSPCRRRSPSPRPAGRPRRRRRPSRRRCAGRDRAARVRRGGGSVTSQPPRVSASTSSPANASSSARPSWPPAPEIRMRRARARTGSVSWCSTGGRREGRPRGSRARRDRPGRTPPSRGRRTAGR